MRLQILDTINSLKRGSLPTKSWLTKSNNHIIHFRPLFFFISGVYSEIKLEQQADEDDFYVPQRKKSNEPPSMPQIIENEENVNSM